MQFKTVISTLHETSCCQSFTGSDSSLHCFSPQEMLGEAEMAAAKKLSENEARVTELTDRWKDRWKETQKILEVWTITGCIILIIVIDNKSSYS